MEDVEFEFLEKGTGPFPSLSVASAKYIVGAYQVWMNEMNPYPFPASLLQNPFPLMSV